MSKQVQVAVIDYGMGNLFSVHQALLQVGLDATLAAEASDLKNASALVLPGVGAFANAMEALKQRGFINPLIEWAAMDRPFFCICLGMQLIMEESSEFGNNAGLGIIPGKVVRLDPGGLQKIPHVGWSQIWITPHQLKKNYTPFGGLRDGSWMYFNHSYHVEPIDTTIVYTKTLYGEKTFCSSFVRGNLFACQFHPERSGPLGLTLFRQFAAQIHGMKKENHHADGNTGKI